MNKCEHNLKKKVFKNTTNVDKEKVMNEIKFRDLRPEEIEVRVGNTLKDKDTGKPYAFQLLLYKTSRTDMAILDETFGMFGWKNHFYQVKNTMVCSIQIYDEEKHEWINKDNGGDDDTAMEQVKSELSDSIKRAGSTLGIGRKLYTASKIYMVVEIDKDNNTHSYYQVKEIAYDETSITKLVIVNKKTKQVVISYGTNEKVSKTTEKAPQNEDESITTTTKKTLQEIVGKFSADKWASFKIWLDQNYKTNSISDLTEKQALEVLRVFTKK